VPAEAFSALSDAILTSGGALASQTAGQYLRAADEISRARRFFHWELESPEVFFAADGTRLADGGFDAVVGNPPWDMIRADGNTARDDPGRVLRFTRDSGIYTAQSDGHANCYQLFAERAVSLTRAGGRVGLVLPAGLATDCGSASLRRLLLGRCDGRRPWWVSRTIGASFRFIAAVRFLLLTASVGRPTNAVACRFGVDDPADLESVSDEPAATIGWFQVRLPSALLERLSGGDPDDPMAACAHGSCDRRAHGGAVPRARERTRVVRRVRTRTERDRRSRIVPQGWGRTTSRRGEADRAVLGGSRVDPLDHSGARCRQAAAGPTLHAAATGVSRPSRARRISSRSSQPCFRAAVRPPNTIFCLRTPLALADQVFLCGLFKQLRPQLSRCGCGCRRTFTTAIVERLPVPTRQHAPRASREIAGLARMLSRGHDPDAHASLQARVAALYQLTAEEFAHVLSTFPLVPEDSRRAALTALTTEAQRSQR